MAEKVWLVKECSISGMYVPFYAGTPNNPHGSGWVCRKYAMRYASRAQARKVAEAYNRAHEHEKELPSKYLRHPLVKVVALRLRASARVERVTAAPARDLSDAELAAMATVAKAFSAPRVQEVEEPYRFREAGVMAGPGEVFDEWVERLETES